MKKNWLIWLAFLLPIAFIIVVTLVVYRPFNQVSTDYDFIYAACDTTNLYRYDLTYRSCQDFLTQSYEVSGGNLTVKPVEPDKHAYKARLFLHDTGRNESREISVAEAQSLPLRDLLTSPDGATIAFKTRRQDGFMCLFGCDSSSAYYLTRGRDESRLNLININDSYYARENFRFLGWVMPSELLD